MLQQLVDQYGYVAVLLGSLLEGETVLLLAGIAVDRGYLDFLPVVGIAFLGGTVGDQVLFLLGRRYGRALLARSPKWAAKAEPVHRLIERHQDGLIVGVRFMYGLRLVGPFVIGMSAVPIGRFALLNMLGAAIWAPLIVGIGVVFGQAIGWLIDDLGHYEAGILAVLVLVAAGCFLVRSRRKKRDLSRPTDPAATARRARRVARSASRPHRP